MEPARGKSERSGTKVRGLGVALAGHDGGDTGYDGLLVITPQGRVRFQSGIANLGTDSRRSMCSAPRQRSWACLGRVCDVIMGRYFAEFSLFVPVVGSKQSTP